MKALQLIATSITIACVLTSVTTGCRRRESLERNPAASADVQTNKPDNDMKAKLQDMKEGGADPAVNPRNRDDNP